MSKTLTHIGNVPVATVAARHVLAGDKVYDWDAGRFSRVTLREDMLWRGVRQFRFTLANGSLFTVAPADELTVRDAR